MAHHFEKHQYKKSNVMFLTPFPTRVGLRVKTSYLERQIRHLNRWADNPNRDDSEMTEQLRKETEHRAKHVTLASLAELEHQIALVEEEAEKKERRWERFGEKTRRKCKKGWDGVRRGWAQVTNTVRRIDTAFRP